MLFMNIAWSGHHIRTGHARVSLIPFDCFWTLSELIMGFVYACLRSALELWMLPAKTHYESRIGAWMIPRNQGFWWFCDIFDPCMARSTFDSLALSFNLLAGPVGVRLLRLSSFRSILCSTLRVLEGHVCLISSDASFFPCWVRSC